jgi:cobalt-zinc-cadmium efflux system outer membrane protein
MPLNRLLSPRLYRIGCVALALATVSFGQTPSAAPLTLQVALARASELNPRLAALGYAQTASEALIEQAGQRPSPTLALSADDLLGTGDYTGLGRSQTTLQLSQTLERGGKREKRIHLASHEREAAAAEFVVQRTDVLAATALAYTACLAAEKRLVLAEDVVKQARELLAALTTRVQSGAGSPTETARARSALVAAQADLARAQTAAASTRATLATYWGGTDVELAPLIGELRIPATLPDSTLALDQLSQNPRIALQQARIASQRSTLLVAKSQTAVDVTASGGLRYYREDSDGALVLGLSVPLPMRNYNQGNIRAARASLAGAEQTLVAIKAELRAELAAAWQELKTAHLTVQTLNQDARPATEEALALVKRGYAQGEIPLTEVFEAQRAQSALAREILDAEWAYAAALVRVEALTNPTYPLTSALLSPR